MDLDDFDAPFEAHEPDPAKHNPAAFEQQLKLERARVYDRFGLELGTVIVTASTPKAVQVSFSTLRLPCSWIPRSQIHEDSPVPRAPRGLLIVTKFLALKLQAYESVPGSGRLILMAEHRKPLKYDPLPEVAV